MRMYACKICFQKFRRLKNLNQHKRTVHAGSKFSCKLCKKHFNRSESLLIHMHIQHGTDSRTNIKAKKALKKKENDLKKIVARAEAVAKVKKGVLSKESAINNSSKESIKIKENPIDLIIIPSTSTKTNTKEFMISSDNSNSSRKLVTGIVTTEKRVLRPRPTSEKNETHELDYAAKRILRPRKLFNDTNLIDYEESSENVEDVETNKRVLIESVSSDSSKELVTQIVSTEKRVLRPRPTSEKNDTHELDYAAKRVLRPRKIFIETNLIDYEESSEKVEDVETNKRVLIESVSSDSSKELVTQIVTTEKRILRPRPTSEKNETHESECSAKRVLRPRKLFVDEASHKFYSKMLDYDESSEKVEDVEKNVDGSANLPDQSTVFQNEKVSGLQTNHTNSPMVHYNYKNLIAQNKVNKDEQREVLIDEENSITGNIIINTRVLRTRKNITDVKQNVPCNETPHLKPKKFFVGTDEKNCMSRIKTLDSKKSSVRVESFEENKRVLRERNNDGYVKSQNPTTPFQDKKDFDTSTPIYGKTSKNDEISAQNEDDKDARKELLYDAPGITNDQVKESIDKKCTTEVKNNVAAGEKQHIPIPKMNFTSTDEKFCMSPIKIVDSNESSENVENLEGNTNSLRERNCDVYAKSPYPTTSFQHNEYDISTPISKNVEETVVQNENEKAEEQINLSGSARMLRKRKCATDIKYIPCKKCMKLNQSDTSASANRKRQYTYRKKRYMCPTCKQNFLKKERLTQHITTSHREIANAQNISECRVKDNFEHQFLRKADLEIAALTKEIEIHKRDKKMLEEKVFSLYEEVTKLKMNKDVANCDAAIPIEGAEKDAAYNDYKDENVDTNIKEELEDKPGPSAKPTQVGPETRFRFSKPIDISKGVQEFSCYNEITIKKIDTNGLHSVGPLGFASSAELLIDQEQKSIIQEQSEEQDGLNNGLSSTEVTSYASSSSSVQVHNTIINFIGMNEIGQSEQWDPLRALSMMRTLPSARATGFTFTPDQQHTAVPQLPKLLPPPVIHVEKSITGSIVLSISSCINLEDLAYYEIYAHPATNNSDEIPYAWFHVADVLAFSTPIFIKLSLTNENSKFYFAIRGVDKNNFSGLFSLPMSWEGK